MRLVGLSISLALTFGCAASQSSEPGVPALGPGVEARDPDSSELGLAERAKELAQKFLIVDGHIDLPYRLEAGRDPTGALTEDVTNRTEKGDFDFVRAREGGLDVPFMSIYVPAKYQKDGGAKKVADGLIDMVESLASDAPDKFQMVTSTTQTRAVLGSGKVGLALGIENGAALESKLENVDHFFNRGVRYITLTHSKDNAICDSSYDDARTHGGLTDFGKSVVTRMNKLGVMIDISHVSDPAFFDVMKLTRAPVIASHSSARHFTPGFE
ncbi:MAG: membrane dipeptidase, partial [Myxococcota bacterium]|nr:membrane dipeptidase [Myxococcota bacterium]